MNHSDCIFCKILRKEIPTELVYEDEHCITIKDIDPCAPIHLLIIPREHVGSLNDIASEQTAMLGHLQLAAAKVAQLVGVDEQGWRLVCNCGSWGGQTVMHLHYHLIGGKILGWPPV